MAKQLVIVESPTKAKTLERYLGPDFSVTASLGHVRDLPEDRMGVDVEHDFQPEYQVQEEKQEVIAKLRRAFQNSSALWLATDFDREGEAIAWHVAESIGADARAANRVTFTEITRDAVQEAFRNPRRVDFDLVDAQQARRIVDRLVGYELSPLLQKGLKRWDLSAGRVQSVALRLIVDREREIDAFVPVEYWSVDARLTPDGDERAFLARLIQVGDEKLAASPDKRGLLLSTQEEAEAHVQALRAAAYRVKEVRKREIKRNPAPPFTTSTLQQEAARKLGFSARKTMQLAQRLYEGITLPEEGQVGLITYMRTDSVNIADQALQELADVVRRQYGPQYALDQPRRYRKKQRGAQEAHEVTGKGANRIEFDQVSVDIEATSEGSPVAYLLRATGQTVKFDGFRRVYFEGRDDAPDEDAESRLPELTVEQVLRLLELLPEQHFTQPPPRFTEASLVKALEEFGIGRPSTYASIISTLVDRGYTRLEDKRFFPEDIGMVVSDILVDLFPEVVDVNFTAKLEEELDDIAEGKARWVEVVREFYRPFHDEVVRAAGKIQPPVTYLDELCPRCPEEGREPGHLVEKLGRYGRFIGCEKYPECRYTRPIEGEAAGPEPEPIGEKCPQCEIGDLVKKTGRFGPFVGCSRYPDCKYIKKEQPKPTGITCPECGKGELVERSGRFGSFYSCNRYPDCTFAVNQRPHPEPCPECGGLVVDARGGARRCIKCARAWDAEGVELPEDKAKALVPKPRVARKSTGRRGRTGGAARKGAGTRTKRSA